MLGYIKINYLNIYIYVAINFFINALFGMDEKWRGRNKKWGENILVVWMLGENEEGEKLKYK